MGKKLTLLLCLVSVTVLVNSTTTYGMDITGGVLVIDGNVAEQILADAEAGYITAYGGCGGRGDLMVDYNNVNPGKTTVWAEPDFQRAWNPDPACDAEGLPQQTALGWAPGDTTMTTGGKHYVFLSTDYQKVANGDLSVLKAVIDEPNRSYDTEPLLLGATYYWRVDEVWTGSSSKGKVWSFTVVDNIVIDDMESYTPNPHYIFDTWLDGSGDVNGVGGNGTGSTIELAAEPVHGGVKSMHYDYDNTASERENGYSETIRTFEMPEDWTDNGEKALVLWFYGDEDNIIEPMWVVLSDGSIEGMSEYGALGDDPNDIKKEDWTDWNIDLQDFAGAGVDLSSIASISIGFGQRGRTKGVQRWGVVYFDDIALYPARCVPKYGPKGDFSNDCVVNSADLDTMADEWLDSGNVAADLNKTNRVDFKDYAIFANNWLEKQLWPE